MPWLDVVIRVIVVFVRSYGGVDRLEMSFQLPSIVDN